MVAIVDYGVGNLFSLRSSFGKLGEEVTVTSDKAILRTAAKIVLPGVGAFGDAAGKLEESGLGQVIREEAEAGKPLLGICLGMQLLFEKSFEYGEYKGLGLIPGQIRPISETVPAGLKIPHMGWNALKLKNSSPLFRKCRDGEYVYFVHSYHAVTSDEYISATAEYGADLTAAVKKKNVYGCQFHPEKSGEVGLKILKAFCGEIGI
jgi:glutamine amidotransferase